MVGVKARRFTPLVEGAIRGSFRSAQDDKQEIAVPRHDILRAEAGSGHDVVGAAVRPPGDGGRSGLWVWVRRGF